MQDTSPLARHTGRVLLARLSLVEAVIVGILVVVLLLAGAIALRGRRPPP